MTKCFSVYLVFLLLSSQNLAFANIQTSKNERINLNTVQAWSVKFGTEIWHFGEFITRRKEVQESFRSTQVESVDGKKLVQTITDDIHSMMELKVSAVRRIVENAENMALSKQREYVPDDFQFHNSKEMNDPSFILTNDTSILETELENVIERPPSLGANLEHNSHFSNMAVNTNISSVHLPAYVYAWAPEVIKGIYWSEALKDIFVSNYQSDPTLLWQYFGSSSGFMRHYPGMKWSGDPVDTYDCRTRSWYMEAAASSKDIVVLVDRSGSMTGQRRDITKHVVTNILDTLGNNDFVNVFTFADTVDVIVPCFADSLVQATMANVREFKLALDTYETVEIANFSAALTHAFELLETYRNYRAGANCNQAIMLVTDGVPYNFKEIFQSYNWPTMPVRVFTYLIGREVADVREVKWMACANRGYYVHLSTLTEVKERVLEYMNVMARPLVLQREEHPVVWSPVYANITDPKVADWLWEQREREEQKERFMSQRKDKALFNSKAEQERRRKVTRMKQGLYSEISNPYYQLMTSVSMPVYDRREYENITENILINEANWVAITKEFEAVDPSEPGEVRIANLLGVAGTDVPLSDIKALMMPYRIGVNGYAFIVMSNGYILIHPDLRPVYQDILKPSYGSVDLSEIELIDDDNPPRSFSVEWMAVRQEIINQKTGSITMNVKYHYDNMHRVLRARRHYFWQGIDDSPFTVVLVLPDGYGLQRVVPTPLDDIHRLALTNTKRGYLTHHHRWSIHPEWLYCRHYARSFPSAEDELLYFLERMSKPGWRWPLKPRPPEQQHGLNLTSGKIEYNRDYYYCDHGLMQALVFNARKTEWFNQNISISVNDDKGEEFLQRFGHTTAFMATHSGLTRWQTFPKPTEPEYDGNDFGKNWGRSIDEVWYKRAVEWRDAYVLSSISDYKIMASHAVWHGSAPAAVVGYQVQLHRLRSLMYNVTSYCGDNKDCMPCHSEEIDCYLVDDNGWIVMGESDEDSGKFFGSIRTDIMQQLIDEEVFNAVHIVDYQAVCFAEKKTTNPAYTLLTPLNNLKNVLSWFVTSSLSIWNMAVFGIAGADYTLDDAIYQNYEGDDTSDEPFDSSDPPSRAKERDFEKIVLIQRTRPTPCDREMYLYELVKENLEEKLNRNANGCNRPFVVQLAKYTNLLLVVVDNLCPIKTETEWGIFNAKEVYYNNSLSCYKHLKPMARNRPKICINNHSNESTIDMCGKASHLYKEKTWITGILIILLVNMIS